MDNNSEVLEIYSNIIETFRTQGVAVYFAMAGGQHQCCLAFDNRVLFESTELDTLHGVFHEWCHNLDKSELGKYIAPF